MQRNYICATHGKKYVHIVVLTIILISALFSLTSIVNYSMHQQLKTSHLFSRLGLECSTLGLVLDISAPSFVAS